MVTTLHHHHLYVCDPQQNLLLVFDILLILGQGRHILEKAILFTFRLHCLILNTVFGVLGPTAHSFSSVLQFWSW